MLATAITAVIVLSLVAVWSVAKFQSLPPFDYQLNVNPQNVSSTQGSSITINVNVTYLQGTPQPVSLSTFGIPTNATYSFSNQTNVPRENNSFISNLIINIPTTTPSGIYSINISSTSTNGKTNSKTCNLSVLNANIQISGTATLNLDSNTVPSELQFIDTATSQSYTADLKFTVPSPFHFNGFSHEGSYSISLPNQRNYTVVCIWDEYGTETILPNVIATGSYSFGPLFLNEGVEVASITKDYSG
jgi:hypothetical protein